MLKDQNSVDALLELIQAQRAHSSPTNDWAFFSLKVGGNNTDKIIGLDF